MTASRFHEGHVQSLSRGSRMYITSWYGSVPAQPAGRKTPGTNHGCSALGSINRRKDKHPNRPASSGGRAVCDGSNCRVFAQPSLVYLGRVRLIARDPTFSCNRSVKQSPNASQTKRIRKLSDRVQGHRLEADNVCSYAGQISAQPRRVDKVDR